MNVITELLLSVTISVSWFIRKCQSVGQEHCYILPVNRYLKECKETATEGALVLSSWIWKKNIKETLFSYITEWSFIHPWRHLVPEANALKRQNLVLNLNWHILWWGPDESICLFQYLSSVTLPHVIGLSWSLFLCLSLLQLWLYFAILGTFVNDSSNAFLYIFHKFLCNCIILITKFQFVSCVKMWN